MIDIKKVFVSVFCTYLMTGISYTYGQSNLVVPDKPNVILIVADDMGLGDLSFLNNEITNTPSINKLAKGGAWFEQAYSASPVCAPARAAILTGQYPHRTGSVTLNDALYPGLTRIKKGLRTIADVFSYNGYATGLIGKWHTGIGDGFTPLDRGFNEFEGFHGFNVPDYNNYELILQDSLIKVDDKYLTEDLNERAINFVRRHKDEPFFLKLAHYAPHRPLGAPQELIDYYLARGFKEETATVYAMIEIMDQGIGDLINELEKLEIRQNTLVIFTSDNGPDPQVGDRFNLNLKGNKYIVDEGGIHVPLIMNWPGKIDPALVNGLVHFIDLFPTLIDICKLDNPFDQKIDGISVSGYVKTANDHYARTVMWQWNRGVPNYSFNAAIRQGDWKLVRPYKSHFDIMLKESTLKPVLYNLKDDPFEEHDLSKSNYAIYKELLVKLEQWSKEVEFDRLSD